MEHIEVFGPPSPSGLGIHPPQQAGIPLGVEDDHHVPPMDILGDQDLGQAGLSDPGGAQHQGVAHPLPDVHPDRLFVRFHRMQGRLAPDRW
jgi:hypothetical protein